MESKWIGLARFVFGKEKRAGRASRPSPPCARHVSAMCPRCVRHVTAMCLLCLPLPATCPHFVSHRWAMCPLKPWPCLWTLSALGLLWGRAVASSGKILSHHCATHSGQFPWQSFWLSEFGLCKRALFLKTVWSLCWYILCCIPMKFLM